MKINVCYRVKEKVKDGCALGNPLWRLVDVKCANEGQAKFKAKEIVTKELKEKGVDAQIERFMVVREC